MAPRRVLKHLQFAICAFAIFGMSTKALAAAWTADFTITALYVAGENNYQYRVYGIPTNAACSNGPTWAYVNDMDSGSKGEVVALLSAFNTSRTIRVLVEPTNGFCHIIEVFVIA